MQPYYFDPITNGGTLTTGTAPAVPVNVPNLTFNMLAGSTYSFYIYVPYQGTVAATATVKACLGGTAVLSFCTVITGVNIGVDGNGSIWVQSSNTLGATARASVAVVAANTTYWVVTRGRAVCTTSGTLTMQIGSGAGVINVQAGGVMEVVQTA